VTTTATLAELTLNQIVQQHPPALEVFARYGMDTCCGGALPVREAAARHGVDLDALLQELSDSGTAGT
jgi:regulator of cell morphogenesis and NO signaling